MALELARTAPAGLRRFYKRSAVTPRNTPSQNGYVPTEDSGIEIDYELLVSNVENMLTADKARLIRNEMKPKDLLVKSNPALFGNMRHDITNPRDMYNFLSKRTFQKLTDDNFLFSKQATFHEERLTRSNSFKDLNKSSNAKFQKKYHFHSHQDLSLIEKRDPSVVALNNNVPYFGPEDMVRLPERERTMMTNFNLPSLNEEGNDIRKEEFNDGNNYPPLSLPMIRSAPTDPMAKGTQDEVRHKKCKSLLGNRTKSNVTFSNKIDKWFSEMPLEVMDKADRAIMEDSIRERMALYQKDLQFDERSPKFNRRNKKLKSLNQIQHQYLELRAETTPKPNRADINFNNYKLKQKSSLNLKTDMNDLDKGDKPSNALPNTNESLGHLNDENKDVPNDLSKSNNQGLKGLKRINLDQFAVDAYNLNPNKRFTFAELQKANRNKILAELQDDDLRRKSDKDHWLRMSQTKTHPSIVNIALDKERKENPKPNHLGQTLSVVKMNGLNNNTSNQMPSHFDDQNNKDAKSRSSTSSSQKPKKQHPSKTVLSKFNTLEVFGGGKSAFVENDNFGNPVKSENPLVKLDLRQLRHRNKHSRELGNSSNSALPKQHNEMSTVDFRFGSGEVIITRKTSDEKVISPDLEIVAKSPNAPPNNTEYSGITPVNNCYSEFQENTNRSVNPVEEVFGETTKEIDSTENIKQSEVMVASKEEKHNNLTTENNL